MYWQKSIVLGLSNSAESSLRLFLLKNYNIPAFNFNCAIRNTFQIILNAK